MGFSTHQPHQQLALCECPKSEMRSVLTTIKTTHGAQFKSQNRRDRFLRGCTPEATLLATQGPASEPEVEPAAFGMRHNEEPPWEVEDDLSIPEFLRRQVPDRH
jgi:hypothetical protein